MSSYGLQFRACCFGVLFVAVVATTSASTSRDVQARIDADPELKKVVGVETLIGAIGIPAAKDGDAEAWNNLESLLGLLIQKKSSVISPVFSKQ